MEIVCAYKLVNLWQRRSILTRSSIWVPPYTIASATLIICKQNSRCCRAPAQVLLLEFAHVQSRRVIQRSAAMVKHLIPQDQSYFALHILMKTQQTAISDEGAFCDRHLRVCSTPIERPQSVLDHIVSATLRALPCYPAAMRSLHPVDR